MLSHTTSTPRFCTKISSKCSLHHHFNSHHSHLLTFKTLPIHTNAKSPAAATTHPHNGTKISSSNTIFSIRSATPIISLNQNTSKRHFYADKQYIYNHYLAHMDLSTKSNISSRIMNLLLQERPSNFTKQVLEILYEEKEKSSEPHLVPFHAEVVYYCLMAYAPIHNLHQMEKLFQFFFVSSFGEFHGEKLEKGILLGTADDDRAGEFQNAFMEGMGEETHASNNNTANDSSIYTSHVNFDWNEFIHDIMQIRKLLSFDAPVRIWRNSLCYLPLMEAYAYHGMIKEVNSLLETASQDMGFSILFDSTWGLLTGNTILKAFKHAGHYLEMGQWFVLWFQCEENDRQAPLIANEETYQLMFDNLAQITQMAIDGTMRITEKDAKFFYNLFMDAYLSLQWEKKRERGYSDEPRSVRSQEHLPPTYHVRGLQYFQPSVALHRLMTLLSESNQPKLVFQLFEDCVQSSLNEHTLYNNKIPSTRFIYHTLIDCASKMNAPERIDIIEQLMQTDYENFGRESLNPWHASLSAQHDASHPPSPSHFTEKFKVMIRHDRADEAFQLFYNNFQNSANQFQDGLLVADRTVYAVLLQGLARAHSPSYWVLYQLAEQDEQINSQFNHVMALSALRYVSGSAAGSSSKPSALLYLFNRLFDSPLRNDSQVSELIASFESSQGFEQVFNDFIPEQRNIRPELSSCALLLQSFADNDKFSDHLLNLLQESLDMTTCTNLYNFLLYQHYRALEFDSFWKLYETYETFSLDYWKNKYEQEAQASPTTKNEHDSQESLDASKTPLLEMPKPGNERTHELLRDARALARCLHYSESLLPRMGL